jgi:hypothetical protein
MATFSRDELLDALDQLIDELVAAGVSAHVRIVGGAGVVLAYDPDRGLTRDVDAVLATPSDEVTAAVARVALRHGWPADWLNTNAGMYAPDPDAPGPLWNVFAERDNVVIEVATAEALLAMKLHAARGRRDAEDIESLLPLCAEVRCVNDAIGLFEAHYSHEVLSDRALAHLKKLFE